MNDDNPEQIQPEPGLAPNPTPTQPNGPRPHLDILDLDGYAVISITETTTHCTIEAGLTAEPACPRCVAAGELVQKRSSFHTMLDCPLRARVCRVHVHRPRYKCSKCGQSHTSTLPALSAEGTLTIRLVDFIREQALLKPLSKIATETGVSPTTVRRMLSEHIAGLEAECVCAQPDVLGIDEIMLGGARRVVLADLKSRKIIAHLPQAQSECSNRIARLAQKVARGWSFAIRRAKVLLG